jgi:Sulfotransferase domain
VTAVPTRLPDFFIVGQPKCGTTALWEMLDAHPEVFMSAVKEPNYFIGETRFWNTPETLDDYLALFAGAGPDQRAGEASVFYLSSSTAASGIAALRPEAKIIAILREPGTLLRSFHLQMVQSRVEPETDLRRALALEPARRESRSLPRSGAREAQMLFYSEQVRYVEQLRRFHDRFPDDQMLVLIYDDFRADNAAVFARILRFLGVDEGVEPAESNANPTVDVRSLRLDGLVHAVSTGRGPLAGVAKKGIKAVTSERLRRRSLDGFEQRVNYRPPPDPDEELMAELRARYRPEVEALSEHLDRNLLALWEIKAP